MQRFVSLYKQRSEDAAKQEAEKRRAEEKKRKTEEPWWHRTRNWNWTAIATCVMAIFTAGIFCVGRYQWSVMQRQLNVMEAHQRPWIEAIPGANKRGIVFDDKGRFEGDLTVNAFNVGTLPAVETRVSAIILPGMGPAPFPVPRYQEQTCLAANAGDQIMFGNMPISSTPDKTSGATIFPQKSFLTGWSFNTNNPRFVFNQIIPRPLPKTLSAIFVGCIAYRLGSFSDKFHHTKFAFEIGEMTVIGSGFSLAPIAGTTTIQPEDVRFREGDVGSNTPD